MLQSQNCYISKNALLYSVCITTIFLLHWFAAMLSPCFAKMEKQSFMKLPSSTNAVESYNRISKQQKPGILKVAMMYTYKQDMAAALENLAITKKVSTTYNDMTPNSRQKVAARQAKARRKRLLRSDDDDGPPDKRRHIARKLCSHVS